MRQAAKRDLFGKLAQLGAGLLSAAIDAGKRQERGGQQESGCGGCRGEAARIRAAKALRGSK